MKMEEKKTIDTEQIIRKLMSGENKMNIFPLIQDEVSGLCLAAKRIMMSQPMLLQLRPPMNICGDLHGQYSDLCRLFQEIGQPDLGQNYLFLGDYVDRGKQSLECICLLLAYKIKYRETFFLLRGNHQSAQTNKIYGFYDECKRRLTAKSWKIFGDCFNCFPISAIVGGRIFCVHGGLSPKLKRLSKINQVRRPLQIQKQSLICDLLWSDPLDIIGWKDNQQRGVSYYYGIDIVKNFLNKYEFDLICRSHQVMEDGYKFFGGRNLLTIFSAPNYCSTFENMGAVLIVEQNMTCHIKHISSKVSEVRKFLKRSVTPLPSKLFDNQSEKQEKSRKKSVKVVRTRTPTKMVLNK